LPSSSKTSENSSGGILDVDTGKRVRIHNRQPDLVDVEVFDEPIADGLAGALSTFSSVSGS
jgi:hypothetical protein